jgi:glucose-6-phosphate 1-dehydrogenase
MSGDSTFFAREDYVEEAWRIVEPLLKNKTPVYPYAPGTWGPNEVDRVSPAGGWSNPDGQKPLALETEAAGEARAEAPAVSA